MNQPTENSTTEELASWNDEMVKKHHKEGTLFESKNPILRALEKTRLKKIKKTAQLKPADKLLDLGCGEGLFISLIPNNIHVVGLDISRLALARAQKILKKRKNTKLIFGNAYHTELPSQAFDKITCSEVLEHVPEPRRVIQEIHRLLKNNGLVIVSVPDEKRIQTIMKIIKFLHLDKFLHAARKEKEYDWHLHQANKNFIYKISQGLFRIKELTRTPALIGYRFVVTLEKI